MAVAPEVDGQAFPASHVSHEVCMPILYVPGEQAVFTVEEHSYPGGQSWQETSPSPLYVPVGQGVSGDLKQNVVHILVFIQI